jgi:hypothetical protein
MKGLRKTSKNLSQGSRFFGQDFNQYATQCAAGVPTTISKSLVHLFEMNYSVVPKKLFMGLYTELIFIIYCRYKLLLAVIGIADGPCKQRIFIISVDALAKGILYTRHFISTWIIFSYISLNIYHIKNILAKRLGIDTRF